MSLTGDALGSTSDLINEARRRELELQRRKGAGWFYWVAGLSVINSLILMIGGGLSFVVGLAVTQVMDAVAMATTPGGVESGSLPIWGFLIDLLIAGGVGLVGYFATKGHGSAFVVGMVLYALNGLVYLAFEEIMPFAFHLLALWFMWRGFAAHRELGKIAAATAMSPQVGGGPA
ncbi:MAG TPA: hypothetical protein VJV75_04340 [Candidatus Polarisedimenticolia bacterium]|nr:hypothetical protein [Candidatus Polarisedimenticolia bacterium]